MRKYLLILLAVMATFAGCQNDAPNDGKPDILDEFIEAEYDTLYLGCASSVENLIYINSHNNFWSFSYDESQEWCFVQDLIDENGKRLLMVNVEENQTQASRELSVTVTNGEAADQIVIVQLASDVVPATEITIADTLYTLTKDMGNFTVEVASDGDYEIVIPEECTWLSHDGTAEGEGVRTETFYISTNYGDDIRNTKVKFVSANASAQIEVVQWGKVDLKVNIEQKSLLFLAGRDSVLVESATDYTANVTKGDWLKINTELSKKGVVVFDYDENPSEKEERTAEITIATASTTKTVKFTQIVYTLTEMPENDNWEGEDLPVTITSVEGTSQMSANRKVERACDGNVMTAWYSATNNDKPQELTLKIDASNVEHINYLRYVPAQGNSALEWGNWREVDIYATDKDGVEKLVASHDFRGGNTTADVNFAPSLPNTTTQLRIVIKNATPYVVNDTECEYVAAAAEISLYAYDPNRFQALDYFKDWSLSELRPEVDYDKVCQIKDPFYRSLAEKMLYGIYDREFRVCEFKAYPKPERDAAILRDKAFGLLDNVTGMYVAEAGTPQYIYLDEDYGQKIYVRVVDWENHEEAGSTNPNTHTYDYQIQKGRNVIVPNYRGLMYILVFSDDYENIPPMTAHFVNSGVNGYIKKGVHTPEDVYRIFMLAPNSEEPRFDMISKSAVLNFRKLNYYTLTFKKDIKANATRAFELMDLYDTIASTQDHVMGLVKYRAKGLPRHHRNRMVYDEVETGALGYSGYYHIGLSNKYTHMWVDPDEIWPKNVTTMNGSIANKGKTIAHELGHSTQTEIFTWRGQIEVTNNLQCAIFQNYQWGMGAGHTWIRYDNGFNGGMQDIATRWVWDFDKDGNWTERPLTYVESVNCPLYGQTTGGGSLSSRAMPLYQLFLFNHVILGNHDFYPDYYEECRASGFNASLFGNNQDKYHSNMLYEFVKSISRVSGYDFSGWAKRWRIPGVNNRVRTNHYGQNYFTNTPEEIAEMEEYCSKFKPLPLDPFYIHDENIELYRNPKPVVAGTHTYRKAGNGAVYFTAEGWQNVAAWLLVDPNKKDDDGNMGRVIAVLRCANPSSTDQFSFIFKESRYVPKNEDNGDYSNYKYSNTEQNNRSMKSVSGDYEYTQQLHLYAVDVYGKRYASGSNK
ncbi:MAG: hypothetical protein J6K81_07245 [Rikenellaceae bacterium]|nr:hypothetical protein [Rikenellaceae bacterium]